MESNKKTILDVCKEFEALTGVSTKFEVMHDSVIGIHVVTDQDCIKGAAKVFFGRSGYRYDFANMDEYKKKHPKAKCNCDFGVYGNIF